MAGVSSPATAAAAAVNAAPAIGTNTPGGAPSSASAADSEAPAVGTNASGAMATAAAAAAVVGHA